MILDCRGRPLQRVLGFMGGFRAEKPKRESLPLAVGFEIESRDDEEGEAEADPTDTPKELP